MDFATAYYVLAAVQIAITIKLCWAELLRESPFVLFWAALLLVYVLPSLLDPFNTEGAVNPAGMPVQLAGNVALLRAQSFYICFAILYWWWREVVSEPLYRGGPSSLLVRLPDARLGELQSSVLLLTIAVALIFMLASVNFRLSTLLEGTYTSYRLQSDTPLKLASYYLGIAVSGSTLLYWLKGKRVLAIGIFGIIGLIFLAGRTRQILAAAILPFAFYYLLKARGVVRMAGIAVGAVGLFLLFALLQFLRYAPSLNEGLRLLLSGALFDQFFVRIAASQGEASLRFAYYYFFEHSDYFGFGHGLSYLRLIMFWLPTSMSGGLKPRDFDEILYTQYYPSDFQSVEGTLHILFPGSAYTNFWWFGVLLAFPLALLVVRLNRWLHATRAAKAAVALGPCCYAAVMFARGSIYNTGMMLLGALAVIWFLFEVGSSGRKGQLTSSIATTRQAADAHETALIDAPR